MVLYVARAGIFGRVFFSWLYTLELGHNYLHRFSNNVCQDV